MQGVAVRGDVEHKTNPGTGRTYARINWESARFATQEEAAAVPATGYRRPEWVTKAICPAGSKPGQASATSAAAAIDAAAQTSQPEAIPAAQPEAEPVGDPFRGLNGEPETAPQPQPEPAKRSRRSKPTQTTLPA